MTTAPSSEARTPCVVVHSKWPARGVSVYQVCISVVWTKNEELRGPCDQLDLPLRTDGGLSVTSDRAKAHSSSGIPDHTGRGQQDKAWVGFPRPWQGPRRYS